MGEIFSIFVNLERFTDWSYSKTCPDCLVVKASASGAGGRRFDTQCWLQWGSF